MSVDPEWVGAREIRIAGLAGESGLRLDEAVRRPERSRPPREVESMLCFIHQHLFDPDLSVKRMRKQLRLANHNVSLRFREVVGMTPRRYIEACRIKTAIKLLRSDVFVYEVAYASGFRSLETFSRAFRRVQGYPPSAFRERSDRTVLQDEMSRRSAKPIGANRPRVPKTITREDS